MKAIFSLIIGMICLGLAAPVLAQATGYIDTVNGNCYGDSDSAGTNPGDVIAGTNDGRIHFVVTKKGKVNATCHGTDDTPATETRGEPIWLDECTIYLLNDTVIGTGHFVAAANDAGLFDGGQFNMKCTGYLP